MYNKDRFDLINYSNNCTIRTAMAWSVSYKTMQKKKGEQKTNKKRGGGGGGRARGKIPDKRLSPGVGFEPLPPKP